MSTKRIVAVIISLLNAVLFVGLFLPLYEGENVLSGYAPYSYIITAFAILGMVTCILNKKVEMNYLTSGALILNVGGTLLNNILEGNSFAPGLGFWVYLIDGFLLLGVTFGYGVLAGPAGPPRPPRPPKPPKQKATQVVGGQGNPTSNTNGIVQQTNSLNMNMPVNNFQSLPVQQVEKEKAPMDLLLGGPQQPNSATAHMSELGLHSINITQDNLQGIDPNAVQAAPAPGGVPITNVSQQVPSAFPTNITQAPPVIQQAPAPGADVQQQMQQQVGQMQQQPVQQQLPPQPRPDLLAGSAMSGQMDNSPFNPQPPQGPGQFI